IFNGAQLMDGPTGAGAPITIHNDAYSIFGVWLSHTATPATPQRVWSQRDPASSNNNGAGLWIYNGNYGDQAEIFSGGFTNLTVRPYTDSSWNISQLNLLNQFTSDFELIDDRNISTGILTLNTDPSGTPQGDTLRNIADV